jgi:hypothetical protein
MAQACRGQTCSMRAPCAAANIEKSQFALFASGNNFVQLRKGLPSAWRARSAGADNTMLAEHPGGDSDAITGNFNFTKAAPRRGSEAGDRRDWLRCKTSVAVTSETLTTGVAAPHDRGPQAVHGSIKMGWRQIAAHHFIEQKHAVGGEHIGQAVIRHFGQSAGRHISLDLATVDAPDLYRNVPQGRHLGQTGLRRGTIAGEHVAEIDVILAEAMPVMAVTAAACATGW